MSDREGNMVLDHKDWVRMFRESVQEVRDDMESQGRGDEFAGAKVGSFIDISNRT